MFVIMSLAWQSSGVVVVVVVVASIKNACWQAPNCNIRIFNIHNEYPRYDLRVGIMARPMASACEDIYNHPQMGFS